MKIPHLRGCYDAVGGLLYFGRMIDKIRLHDAGRLPADYHDNLGKGFDGRVARWLGIGYAALQAEVRRGRSDEELLEWARAAGINPSPERIEILNNFLLKRGWRDAGRPSLVERLRQAGHPLDGAALTHFDFIDLDEGRPLRFGPDPAPVAIPPRPLLEGLRSPYQLLGGLHHLGRMFDKIRLHAAGKLPPSHIPALGCGMAGTTYDGRVCRFLDLDYDEVVREVLKGAGTDDAALARWIAEHGRSLTDEEKETFNGFLAKRGWRDDSAERLHFRLREAGMPLEAARVMFDYIDLDEGRPLPKFD